MSYRVLERLDGQYVTDRVVDHPDLHLEVTWYINGEPQGKTTIGYRAFLMTADQRYCLEMAAVEGCACP